MKNVSILLLVVLAVAAWLFFAGKSNYNAMVNGREDVKSQWAQVENQYQRRADLIPNIVNTVKGVANFEQKTLTEIVEARAKVGQLTVTKEILEDPELMQKFTESQNQLSQTLSRFLSVTENYPDLKANQSFNALIAELEGTENRISVERKKFNDSAKGYNVNIKQFPRNLFASFFGFKDVAYFEGKPGSENAPTVDFGK